MSTPKKRNSILCPNCRGLVSKTAPSCPYCGIKNPGSAFNNNLLMRAVSGQTDILKPILMANGLFFLFSLAIDMRPSTFSSSPFSMLSPSGQSLLVLGSSGTIPLFQMGRWWTVISANYLHGSLMHIAFNMIALYQLGPLIIREYGASRMIAIYTLSGVFGYLLSSLFGVRFTIGASAAVCGLIGAALYYGKSRGGNYGEMIYSQIGGWALFLFVFGFLVPGINNIGHGGGMLAGAIFGYLLGYNERKKETIYHKYIGVACIIATLAVLLLSFGSGLLFLLR